MVCEICDVVWLNDKQRFTTRPVQKLQTKICYNNEYHRADLRILRGEGLLGRNSSREFFNLSVFEIPPTNK